MTTPDAAPDAPSTPPEAKKVEIRTLCDVLRSLTGRVATVSNPESMEAIPLGFQIKPAFYRAKILRVYDDVVAVATEFSKSKTEKSPGKQFISMAHIKRVCILKDAVHIHL